MTAIAFDDRYQKVTPSSSTDELTIDFPIASTDDLTVKVDGTETVDFTVTATFADGIATGAKLNINTPVVADPTVEIIGDRDPARTQFTVSSGHNLVGKINAEVAQRTVEIQENHRDVLRAIKVAFGEEGFTLPDADTRADKYFGWDSNGDPEMRHVAASEVTYSNAVSGLSATDVQAALDEIDADIDGHIARTDNPHSVTKAQVGLGNVTNDAQVAKAGDTMTGFLTLHSNPTASNHAATKAYVDSVGGGGGGGGTSADQVSYDNSTSGLTAVEVQAAIDELDAAVDALEANAVPDGDKGDITVSSSGTVWTINSGVITAGKLAADAVETVKILNAAVTTAKLANSAVATAKIADDAVTLAKMQHGAAGDILYYGASGVPTRLAKGTDGQGLVLSGGVPAWDSVGGPTRVRKTSDETVSSSSVLQDDDDLKYALGANEKVRFQLLAFVESDSTANIKIAVTVPTGATLIWVPANPDNSAYSGTPVTGSGTAESLTLDSPSQTDRAFILEGVVVNGGTAGDLQIQWAQDTADAVNTKMLTNSTLMVWTF